jgi:branched-chain amino acid transport system ATP-binding protein
MLLALDDVTTYYGKMRILEGINIQVDAGELVCLLGGNASGKSTTLKTILGIVRPRAGRSTARTSRPSTCPTASREGWPSCRRTGGSSTR